VIPGFIVVESGFGEGIGNRRFWEQMERHGGVVLKSEFLGKNGEEWRGGPEKSVYVFVYSGDLL